MKNSPLLIVLGEPNSIFSEILFKTFKKNIFKKSIRPILIIGSMSLLKKQMRLLKYFIKIKECKLFETKKLRLDNKCLNIINVKYKYKKTFDKISIKSNRYIDECFKIALDIIKKEPSCNLINGPVSKTHFLRKKYLGITEYLANKVKVKKKPTMLIYNSYFSVCPISTHLPINKVSKSLSKDKIIKDVLNIKNFYNLRLKKKPKFAVLGLNPHCETVNKYSEEKSKIIPAIKHLKKNKKINISGPFSADTFFSKNNLDKYDVAIGMYHDQVLTPMKTLFGFNAINITLGLPFLRVSPDHGTNINMIGKNKSSPDSLIYSINFFKKVK